MENFYRKKNSFSNNELKKFIENNKEQLKMKYLDFSYLIINPKNLIGIDEFNQSFFDKIDKIEIDIANGVNYENIISNLDIIPIKRKNFKISSDKDEIEKKIFELRNNNIDIFESGNEYVLYNIENIYEREPDLNEIQTKNEISNLLFKKSRFDYNQELLKKIKNKSFNNSDFNEMGKDKIKSIKLNSIKDNKKFEINSVKVLYSLPVNSFTLINDENNNIFLAKVKEFENKTIEDDKDKLNEYINKQNSNIKNNMLKSFDLYLNSKYQVDLNQKTIERIKNFFQ